MRKLLSSVSNLSSFISHFSFLNSQLSTLNSHLSPRRGFTLIELAVAITVAGILGSGLITAINPKGQMDKAANSQRLSDTKQIKNSLSLYYQDKNCYPNPTIEASFRNALQSGSSWKEGDTTYIQKFPKDPSGTSYAYLTDTSSNCPQWSIVFTKLSNAKEGECNLPFPSACYPADVDSSWECSVSGIPTCIEPSPTPVVPLPTATPTPFCEPVNVATAVNEPNFAWRVAGNYGTPPDIGSNQTRSLLKIYENAVEMGPAHSSHADIRNLGQGRFSHWSDGAVENLYFSAIDNSNPKTNGKDYQYCVGKTPSPTPTAIPGACTNGFKDTDKDGFGTGEYDCWANSASYNIVQNRNDCNDGSDKVFQNRANMATDGDKDGYISGLIYTPSVCVGATQNTGGRTYYNDVSNNFSWISSSEALGVNDCQDSNGNIYQNVAGLVPDNDQDGFNTGSPATVCVGGSFTQNNPPAGTAGSWSMNENTGTSVGDSSGNNNNGLLSGATWTSPGKLGISSLNFNGTSAYVAIPDSASLRLTTGLTISSWFKTNVSNVSQNIIRKDAITGSRYLWGLIVNSTTCSGQGKLSAQYYNGSGPYGGVFCINSVRNVNDGNWHHAAITISGTTMTLYLDGISQGSTTITGTMEAPNGELDIGAGPPYVSGGRYSFFQGTIDEAKIYNRVLSQAEITLLVSLGRIYYMNSAGTYSWLNSSHAIASPDCDDNNSSIGLCPPPLPTPTPTPAIPACPANYLASWKLNEGSGQAIYDSSGNSLNGTAYGTTIDASGKLFRSRIFNGTSDYISGSINGTALTNATVSLWFKPASNSGTKGVFQWANALTSMSPFILIQNDNGTLKYYVDGNYRGATSGITVGTWYHVVVTLSNSTQWRFYVNGNQVGGATGTYTGGVAFRSNATGVYLGNGYNGYFNGAIDEVSILNSSLTQTEILGLYNSGTGLDCFTPVNVNATINPKPVFIDGIAHHTIVLTSVDVNGGSTIDGQVGTFNAQGAYAGQYRGHFSWLSGNWWAGGKTSIACSPGGGYGAIYNGYGPEYIDIVSCSTAVTGNQRQSTIVLKLNQGPLGWPANNTLSLYSFDAQTNYNNWSPYETFSP